jgi:protein SCO1/2
VLLAGSHALARPKLPTLEVGVNEKLGAQVPGNISFVDEKGDTVKIGDLVDRPTLVSLVYYTCPSVCRPLLEEVTTMLGKLEKLDMQPNRDYRMITISFDETDSPAGSARVKDEYYKNLPDGFPRDGWTFLTGDSASVAALTQAVGFSFKRYASGFAHPTTLVVLSKDRTITRYLTGSEYLPLDIKWRCSKRERGVSGPPSPSSTSSVSAMTPKGRNSC